MWSEHKDLLNYLSISTSASTAAARREETEWIFEKLLLPLPKKTEYFSTAEGGAIVLLAPYGSALRITSPRQMDLERDFLKRTFLVHSFHAADMVMQLCMTAAKETKKEAKKEATAIIDQLPLSDPFSSIKDFWSACHEQTRKGLLTSRWMDVGKKFGHETSERYAVSIRQSSPHNVILK